MKKIMILLIVSLMGIFGCGKNVEKVTIAGSTTVLPIAQSTAEAFMGENDNADVSVRGGGSSVGIVSVLEGTVDIGNASRLAKDKEIKKAKEANIDLVQHIVAFDGIAVITDRGNSVAEISLDDLRKIYSGEYTNWKQLGGSDQTIVVISRDASSGTFETFEKRVMHEEEIIASALNLGSNNAVVTSVKSTEGAIGYIGYGYIIPEVNVLNVDGVKISKEAIKSGEYAISRSLQMYTNGQPEGMAKKYLDFVKSAKGQKIVAKQGFVEIN